MPKSPNSTGYLIDYQMKNNWVPKEKNIQNYPSGFSFSLGLFPVPNHHFPRLLSMLICFGLIGSNEAYDK